jgi:Mn2+/Fe2+ NRAMP family transporter
MPSRQDAAHGPGQVSEVPISAVAAGPECHWLRILGPGLLLAAACVGASHLVQSTRAGAMSGTALLFVIVVAMSLKYPAFRLAPHYTAVTGRSMLDGFRRQGAWAIPLFSASCLGTVFVGNAAITIVTAAIAQAVFGLDGSIVPVCAVILIVTAGFLLIGRYHFLDLGIKILMAVLAVATVAAVALTLPLMDWNRSGALWPAGVDLPLLLFMVALYGWMPAPLEAAVMHTLWAQAKGRDLGAPLTARQSAIDFHVGYLLTLFLAFCFVLLGAALMHGRGVAFADSGAGFARQLVDLYAIALGDWSRPLIGVAALAVMYSTILTSLDGFSRIFSEIIGRTYLASEYEADSRVYQRRLLYAACLLTICGGSMLIILYLMKSFKAFIDLATTIAFISTPIFAILIHRAVNGPDIPDGQRPGTLLRRYSFLCNILLVLLAAGCLLMLLMTD